MDIVFENALTYFIALSLVTLFLLVIKNKLINIILTISEKTNTIYDELLLHSIKTPTTYLIIFTYLLIVFDYLGEVELISIELQFSSLIYILIVISIAW